MKESFKIESSSGVNLDVSFFKSDESKALIQIVHGMQEHKERYDDFANYLCSNGYDVVIHDHLGHGQSINEEHPLGDLVSLENLITDIHLVRKEINFKGEYICFGHSMGSFLARIYSSIYPVDKLVACGTGQPSKIAASFLKFLLKFQKEKTPLPNIQKLVIGPYEKKFEEPSTWISYNEDNRRAYMEDKLCGNPFTREGFETLADIVVRLNNEDTFKNCTAKEILLIAGSCDPVGDFSKGIKKVEDKYKSYGKSVQKIIYQDMAHEILNEKENNKVYKDVLEFVNK